MAQVDQQQASAAVTDVGEFIAELDGGVFERQLSAALSLSAAACVDNQKQSEVTIKLVMKPITGTHQVHVQPRWFLRSQPPRAKRPRKHLKPPPCTLASSVVSRCRPNPNLI